MKKQLTYFEIAVLRGLKALILIKMGLPSEKYAEEVLNQINDMLVHR